STRSAAFAKLTALVSKGTGAQFLPLLRRLLEDPDEPLRSAAAYWLAYARDLVALEKVVRVLGEGRSLELSVLERPPPGLVVPELVLLLEQAEPVRRIRVVKTLRRLVASPGAASAREIGVAALRRRLADGHVDVQAEAAIALGELGEGAATAHLVGLLR